MRLRLLGRILAAQSLSSLGTSISTIALASMVQTLTGSVLQMGAVLAVSTFPLVITSFVGGAILDRFNAKSVMVFADLCRAVLIFSMPFLAERSTGYIYVVAALMGIFSSLFNPGQVKLVGELAERKVLVKANSYLGVSRDGAELLGYLAGAPLVIALGYTVTFGADAVSYILSALLLVGLPKALPLDRPARTFADLLGDTPEVLRIIRRRPALRTNVLLAVFAATAITMSIPNCYVLAFDFFGRGNWGLTALEVFTASGMIVGGLLVSRMSLAGDKNAYVAFGLIMMGICFVAVSFSNLFWLSISFIGVAGMANVVTFVPSMTLFQETPEEAHRGRLLAIRSGFGQIGATVGLLVGGVLGSAVGIREAFLVAGFVGIGLTLIIFLPHRVASVRRAQAVWEAALAGGACRRDARALADAALCGGDVAGELIPVPVPAAASGEPRES
jgi:MFS family permease